MTQPFIHQTAVVDAGASIGDGTKIWHFSHVFAAAVIGERCVLGQNTMIADGVYIGNHVKIQNNVSIYTGTDIEDDVFLGPSCVLTNVTSSPAFCTCRFSRQNGLCRDGTAVPA